MFQKKETVCARFCDKKEARRQATALGLLNRKKWNNLVDSEEPGQNTKCYGHIRILDGLPRAF